MVGAQQPNPNNLTNPMSFSDLKKQSSLGSLTQKLVKEVEKQNNTGGSNTDERLWKPEMDKTGNGFAVIRFLPAPDGEDLPWAKCTPMPSKVLWLVHENSLTTNGGKDPVSEHNRDLGTVVSMPIRILSASRSVNSLIMLTFML